MKATIPAFLCFLFLAAPAAVQAQSGSGDGYDYIINASNANTITITNYTGPGGFVSIPSNINNLTVTGIGNGIPFDLVFFNISPTSVSIPNSVTSVGDSAFLGCSRLTSISVGNGVTSFGLYTFASCTSLTGVYFKGNAPAADPTTFEADTKATVYYLQDTTGWGPTFAGLPTAVGQADFGDGYGYSINASNTNTITITNYTGLGGVVTIPNYINGLLVTGIGDSAFDAFLGNISPTSVSIPDSVTSIGSYAFNECASLINVKLGNGVTNIGTDAFENCTSLVIAYFQGNAPGADPSVFANDPVTVYYLPGTTGWSSTLGGAPVVSGIYYAPFTYVTNSDNTLTITGYAGVGGAVTIPTNINGRTVTAIGNEAFVPSLGIITSVTMLDSITSIGDFAFAGHDLAPNTTLTNVAIPGSVTNMGSYVFTLCCDLTGVTISNGVTNIGSYDFFYCTNLTSVTIPGSVTSIGDSAFDECWGMSSVYFTGNAPIADSTAFPDHNPIFYRLADTTGWSNFTANTGVATTLWNPLIQASGANFGMRSNQFGFNITGTNNFTVVVEACTNLASPVWTPLQTVTLTNGSFYFSEPLQTNGAGRFYGLGLP
jgi:hypothetical protein